MTQSSIKLHVLRATSGPLSISELREFHLSQRTPCLKVHAYCFRGPKTIWTTVCFVLSFFHTSLFLSFSLFIPLRVPVASIPFHLIFSGCQAATLPSYDSRQKLGRKLLGEETGRQPTGRRCGGGGGHVCVIRFEDDDERLQEGACKKCWQQQGSGREKQKRMKTDNMRRKEKAVEMLWRYISKRKQSARKDRNEENENSRNNNNLVCLYSNLLLYRTKIRRPRWFLLPYANELFLILVFLKRSGNYTYHLL